MQHIIMQTLNSCHKTLLEFQCWLPIILCFLGIMFFCTPIFYIFYTLLTLSYTSLELSAVCISTYWWNISNQKKMYIFLLLQLNYWIFLLIFSSQSEDLVPRLLCSIYTHFPVDYKIYISSFHHFSKFQVLSNCLLNFSIHISDKINMSKDSLFPFISILHHLHLL